MKAINVILVALIAMIILPACSDDNNDPNPNKSDWEKDLKVKNVTRHEGDWGGYIPMGPDIVTANVYIKNSKGEDLLNANNPNNVLGDKFYVEYKGEKFFYADSIDIPGNLSRIETGIYPSAPQYYLQLFYLGGNIGMYDNKWTEYPDVDEALTFCWPERNLSYKIRVYRQYNNNFPQLWKEAAIGDPVWLATIGTWINDISVPGLTINLTVD